MLKVLSNSYEETVMGDTKIQGIDSSEPSGGKEKSESREFNLPFLSDFHQSRQHEHNTKLSFQLYLEWIIFLLWAASCLLAKGVFWL